MFMYKFVFLIIMRVLLINPWGAEQVPPPSIGYLQSALKTNGIDVTATDLNYGADGYVFETKDWDKILVSKIQHPYNLLWFDDGIQHGNSCAFPIVSRQWIDLMGFFIPEIFIHNYSDTFVYDVAKKAGVCVYIPEVQNRHLHFSIIPEVFDKTYEEGLKNDSWSKDAVTYGASEGIRIELAQRIKDKLV